MTLKGFGCNDPANVSILHPDTIQVSAGPWLTNMPPLGVKWVIALCYNDYGDWLTFDNVRAAMRNPNYVGEWIVGLNEPNPRVVTAQQHAEKIKEQMDIVLGADPAARFAIGNMTHDFPCYTEGGHIDEVWRLLLPYYCRHIKAMTQHIYPPATMRDTFLEMVAYCTSLGKEAWITEIGRPIVYVENSENYTPTRVLTKANNCGIDRVYWYQQRVAGNDTANYYCLLDSDGNITDYGRQFAAIRYRYYT